MVHEIKKSWQEVYRATRGAVVQVSAQVVPFNWAEPYSNGESFEQRGSGFIIHERGFILTAAHLVDQARRVTVQIPACGTTWYPAQVVSFCPDRDVALLRLDDEAVDAVQSRMGAVLPVLTLDKTGEMHVGDEVLTIGYPLGDVRAKGALGAISGYQQFGWKVWMQTTVPLNPGNSGGPLINDQAQVVAIALSTLIDAQQINYAVPISLVRAILDDMYHTPFVRLPVLGLVYQNASDELAQLLKNPLPAGVYINNVVPQSLAERATIQQGDMLYEINGTPIDESGQVRVTWSDEPVFLPELITRLSVGDPVEMVIYRQGKKQVMKFSYDLLPPYAIRSVFPDYEEVDYEVLAGMVFMQLTIDHIMLLRERAPHLVEYTQVERQVEPVLMVSHVISGSMAANFSVLRQGAIITHVNEQPVATLAQVRAAVRQSLQSGYLIVRTSEQGIAVFAFDRVVADEVKLATSLGYQPAEIVKEIIQQTMKATS